jgi:hypothetical protein
MDFSRAHPASFDEGEPEQEGPGKSLRGSFDFELPLL